MAYSAFRGCEKRVLSALAAGKSYTKPELRRFLTQGNLPISEVGVKNGLTSCLHYELIKDEDGVLSITEKGIAWIAQKSGKLNPKTVENL